MNIRIISSLVVVAALSLCEGCALFSPARPLVRSGERIGFLGDSITELGDRPTGYVNLVMKGLEIAGVQAEKVPAGKGGHKSPQMLERVDRDVLSKNVDWMTLSCGVNDVWHGDLGIGVSLEDFKKNLSEVLDKCAASNVTVVVMTATMIGEDLTNANNGKLEAYNAWLREEAARRNLPLADTSAILTTELKRLQAEKKEGLKLTVDGVHMAFPGNCLMAWGVLKAFGVDDSLKDEIFAAWHEML